MRRIHLECAQLSDKGMVRTFNEDNVLCDRENGLFVLADGMGGYKAGDVASSMAAQIIQQKIVQGGATSADDSYESGLVNAIASANSQIYRAARLNRDFEKMGTTVVVAHFHDDVLSVAHVGDSRLYRMRRGKMEALTLDHSLLQEQITLGLISPEEARLSHNRNLVTRALGAEGAVVVDTQRFAVEEGDIYLLCSDGLNDMVNDEDIALALSTLSIKLPLAAEILVQMANDNGGHDNVSVILIRASSQSVDKAGLTSRLFGWLKR